MYGAAGVVYVVGTTGATGVTDDGTTGATTEEELTTGAALQQVRTWYEAIDAQKLTSRRRCKGSP